MKTTQPFIIQGNGPLVVLLHSSMSSKAQWLPLIQCLESEFEIIALDLAGYGDRPFPSNPNAFSTQDEVHSITQILRSHFGDEKSFHLVGHSYGGAIALKLAFSAIGRINSLTLFEPVLFHLLQPGSESHVQVRAIVDQIVDHLGIGDRFAATECFIDFWSGKGTFENLNTKAQKIFISGIDKVVLDFKALFEESLTIEEYSTIHSPVCLIKGTKSPVPSLEIFEILSHTLIKNKVHTVQGGHMSPITHFKPVNDIIKHFLKDN